MTPTENHSFRIGIAPISWVNDDIPGLGDDLYTQNQVLSEMADIGYVSTEMGRIFSQDMSAFKDRLKEHGIQLASKFVGVLFSDPDRQEKELQSFTDWVKFLQEMNCEHVITCEMGGSMHWDPRRSPEDMTIQKLTDREWNTLVEGLHQAARIAQEHGIQLVYHPHAGTVVETKEEVDRLMAWTDPGLVHLLYDTGHALYGGYDPLEQLRTYEDRITYVHLKDVRRDVLEYVRKEKIDFRTAVVKGLFTVPGDEEGCIDFEPVFKALMERGYEGWWIVEAEQDPAVAHPYKYAKMAKDYIVSTMMSIQALNQR
ncbi:myo-inosose-2 dehydratase [Paludifilum halophilum]|uniref:Myo-inosose-2 dehydratase n=1 Tax=Paludifilum halophilum TaxID=1642702 RepID=A0A235B715_9BACL|nr:myo-inosose-2 dehydratase [Paludifilum halophilum]OYD07395.1 myo-inosose-2 dehydratase [Paludifilum halophilum]